MGSKFTKNKDYKKAIEQIRAEAEAEAHARARYRVQDDFNNELISEIARQTGHETLASTCFVDVDLNSYNDLDVHVYNDWTVIEGVYSSKSSYHQSGGKWQSIQQNYNLHKDDFWARKESGSDLGDSYGTVDPDWLADNFWDGIVWVTNGWPFGGVEYLESFTRRDVSAISVIQSYYDRYVRSNRFAEYIQEELDAMS